MKYYHTLFLSASLAWSPLATAADIIWNGNGGDGLWSTAANWDTNTVPTADDNARINGTATVSINQAAQASRVYLGLNDGDNVTLNVNSTLTYLDTSGFGDWGMSTSNVVVNINDGGVINGGGAFGSSSRIDGAATVNVFSGGSLTNISRMQGGGGGTVSILVDGGTFAPTGNAGTLGSMTFGAGLIELSNGGKLLFRASGSNTNDRVSFSTGTSSDWTDGIIQLFIEDGYTPQVGDFFDLTASQQSQVTIDIGDGSNIATTSADGHWLFEYDLSEWNYEPFGANYGKITLTSVTAIPEPSYLVLIASLFVAFVARFYRKRV